MHIGVYGGLETEVLPSQGGEVDCELPCWGRAGGESEGEEGVVRFLRGLGWGGVCGVWLCCLLGLGM